MAFHTLKKFNFLWPRISLANKTGAFMDFKKFRRY